jgi:hypothetical protein
MDSPELIDHLVTFIACQILTSRGLTEILGNSSGRLWAASRRRRVQSRYAALRILAGSVCAGLFPD